MHTEISSINRSVEHTLDWVHAFNREIGIADSEAGFQILKTSLKILRDRITMDEAVDLSAQMPAVLRGFFLESWDPSKTPRSARTPEDLADLFHTYNQRRAEQLDPLLALKATAKLLRERISSGELRDVEANLPEGIREFLALTGSDEEEQSGELERRGPRETDRYSEFPSGSRPENREFDL